MGVTRNVCFSLLGPCESGSVKICVYQSMCTQVTVCVRKRGSVSFQRCGSVYRAVLVCVIRCVCAHVCQGGRSLCA